MWLAVFLAGTLGGMTYPALAVYRTELFPTGNRGRAAGLLTATALLGGIGGLLVMGTLLDRDWSHGSVMALLASAQVLVVVIVLRWYPETAHRELEDLNPEDAVRPSVPSMRQLRRSVRRRRCVTRRAWHVARTYGSSGAASSRHSTGCRVDGCGRYCLRRPCGLFVRGNEAASGAWRERGSFAARSRRRLAGLRAQGRRVGRPAAVGRGGAAGHRRRLLPHALGARRATRARRR